MLDNKLRFLIDSTYSSLLEAGYLFVGRQIIDTTQSSKTMGSIRSSLAELSKCQKTESQEIQPQTRAMRRKESMPDLIESGPKCHTYRGIK